MSTQFQVDTQQIQTCAADIQRVSSQLESDVATLTARVTTLQEAWRGSAAAGFQQAAAEWSSTQRQVRSVLDQLQATLARAGTQYNEVEAANTALFRSS